MVSRILERSSSQMSDLQQQLRYVPYHELGDRPNIIVDGAAADGTLLTLSHWPQNTTPAELKRDTSTEIAFAYLDLPEYHVDAEVASNNHFDQDGLAGLFVLLDPKTARNHRELLIDVASAGDFGVFERLDAARISFLLSALVKPAGGFLSDDVFALPSVEQDAACYRALLVEMPGILGDLESYRSVWEPEERHLLSSLDLLQSGKVTISEDPGLDLAIVRLPESLAPANRPDAAITMDDLCHPFAICSATPCNRILLVCGQAIEFRYRYESWVQMTSRKPVPRVSLADLAAQLNQIENSGGVWRADDVNNIKPVMRLDGSRHSSIPAENFITRLQQYLVAGVPAWDPYARKQAG